MLIKDKISVESSQRQLYKVRHDSDIQIINKIGIVNGDMFNFMTTSLEAVNSRK